MIIDRQQVMGLAGVNASFIIPFICFLVVLWYGFSETRRAAVKA
jgi:fucose permease